MPLASLARIRIDKWLWAARFFKTRSLAVKAVDGGKVHLNGERVKPSKDVKCGDEILVASGELEWSVHVLAISDRRGSAEQARGLYAETEASSAKREVAIAARKSGAQPVSVRRGRPTKRDRRLIHRFTVDR